MNHIHVVNARQAKQGVLSIKANYCFFFVFLTDGTRPHDHVPTKRIDLHFKQKVQLYPETQSLWADSGGPGIWYITVLSLMEQNHCGLLTVNLAENNNHII